MDKKNNHDDDNKGIIKEERKYVKEIENTST